MRSFENLQKQKIFNVMSSKPSTMEQHLNSKSTYIQEEPKKNA